MSDKPNDSYDDFFMREEPGFAGLTGVIPEDTDMTVEELNDEWADEMSDDEETGGEWIDEERMETDIFAAAQGNPNALRRPGLA